MDLVLALEVEYFVFIRRRGGFHCRFAVLVLAAGTCFIIEHNSNTLVDIVRSLSGVNGERTRDFV